MVRCLCGSTAADAEQLFAALHDERAWEHIPRAVPRTADELDAAVLANSTAGQWLTFTVRRGESVVGRTSMMRADFDGVEIGGTQLDPTVWGTG